MLACRILMAAQQPVPPITKEAVLAGVSKWVEWWVGNRRNKLIKLNHESHAINPFLLPIIMSMHGFASIRDLAFFMLSGHLVEGHATGFGKLIDEKILSNVFGTIMVDRKFRKDNPEYQASQFDNIDHIVVAPGRIPRPSFPESWALVHPARASRPAKPFISGFSPFPRCWRIRLRQDRGRRLLR